MQEPCSTYLGSGHGSRLVIERGRVRIPPDIRWVFSQYFATKIVLFGKTENK